MSQIYFFGSIAYLLLVVLFSVESDCIMDNKCDNKCVKKIPNFKTFQIECLRNFLLVVMKVTKQSCCHRNHISRIM